MLGLANQWRGLAAAGTVYALLLGAGGCGKDPVKPQAPAPPMYLTPSSPQNVLKNLVTAYVNRDSVGTASVYDSVYVGTSTDLSSPTPILTFTRADEIRHVGILKLNQSIVSVFVDLGASSTWQRLPAGMSDPADWATIQLAISVIQIEDITTSTTYQTSNQIMEYTFKPTVAAPGDTTWTIARWVEIAN